MNQDYEQFYSRISAPFRKNPARIQWLNRINTLLTRVVYVIYPLFILNLIWKQDMRWIKVTAIPAIAFILLSAVRGSINRPRPYETWKLDPLIKKDTHGKSMPSRHVFSATVIAMAFLSIYPSMGIFFLIWSCILALVRILGGVHYPSDVAAGLLVGVLSGLFLLI